MHKQINQLYDYGQCRLEDFRMVDLRFNGSVGPATSIQS
jgi:hypothetical protein